MGRVRRAPRHLHDQARGQHRPGRVSAAAEAAARHHDAAIRFVSDGACLINGAAQDFIDCVRREVGEPGRVDSGASPGFAVPAGFTVPFSYYDAFIKQNEIDDKIYELLNDQKFIHDPAHRRGELTKLREKIQQGTFDAKLRAEVLRRWRADLGGRGVFARSSTNSEDLPNFSGAGIYTSVPNLKSDDQLIEGIKDCLGVGLELSGL